MAQNDITLVSTVLEVRILKSDSLVETKMLAGLVFPGRSERRTCFLAFFSFWCLPIFFGSCPLPLFSNHIPAVSVFVSASSFPLLSAAPRLVRAPMITSGPPG